MQRHNSDLKNVIAEPNSDNVQSNNIGFFFEVKFYLIVSKLGRRFKKCKAE